MSNIVQCQSEIKESKSDIDFFSEVKQVKSPKYPKLKRRYDGKTFIYLAPLGFIVTLSHHALDNNQGQISLSGGKIRVCLLAWTFSAGLWSPAWGGGKMSVDQQL